MDEHLGIVLQSLFLLLHTSDSSLLIFVSDEMQNNVSAMTDSRFDSKGVRVSLYQVSHYEL